MSKKLYITEPKLMASVDAEFATLCYQVLEWEQGMVALAHGPCLEETRVSVPWGAQINDVRVLVLDKCLANFPDVTSNDIIFLGGWV